MVGRDDHGDSRVNAARYVVDKLIEQDGGAAPTEPETAGRETMSARVQYVEIAIEQAIRRGDFDDLPGAGKPLDLGRPNDPDWWIRRKIERERLTGLGPPALTLRTENAELEARLDATGSEQRVRELLADFNARVVEARRQLQGGPPVVTPTRDIEREVALWRERRADRRRAAEDARRSEAETSGATTWRARRRAKRRAAGAVDPTTAADPTSAADQEGTP